ncbi:hypothetical protein VARIO8X_160085 [Burkholderiales bacterium 8X]|nr:hypothetical protein VARIO8X_160085 [Burkholderiales bacterium 8X]
MLAHSAAQGGSAVPANERMKKLWLLAVVVVAAWWFLVGGRKLDTSDVTAFFDQFEAAALDRQPEVLCNMLAPEYAAQPGPTVGEIHPLRSSSREDACNAFRRLFADWARRTDREGAALRIVGSYKIHSIQFGTGKRTAIVQVSSRLGLANAPTQLELHGVSTIVRRNGKVLLLNTEFSNGPPGPAAAAPPVRARIRTGSPSG